MRLLKDVKDVKLFWDAITNCKGSVYVQRYDENGNIYERLDAKSLLSRYVAIGELAKEHGDEYEIFCYNKDDEQYLLQFFYDIGEHNEQ